MLSHIARMCCCICLEQSHISSKGSFHPTSSFHSLAKRAVNTVGKYLCKVLANTDIVRGRAHTLEKQPNYLDS